MSSKKDLKMMYSLRWKHDPNREPSSFVVVYDIPAITMNYQVFKNYLLKNSGNPVEDIRVSYFNGQEYSLNNQAEYQRAMYLFRGSARAGNVINLILERVSDRYQYTTLLQNDVQTQFDTCQDDSIDSSCTETPPKWFQSAIKQLKAELKKEVLSEMNLVITGYLHRKFVAEQLELEKELEQMDARPITLQTSLPHMIGGEVYLHQWEVQNTGKAAWNAWTELQYTWGSKHLVPVKTKVPVPFLKPGDRGVVSVCLNIPSQNGNYECYWQFMHKGRRFGQSLGLKVIVDGFQWTDSPRRNSNIQTNFDHDFHFPSADSRKKNIPKTEVVVEPPASVTEAKNIAQNNSIKWQDKDLNSVVVRTVSKDEQAKKGFIYVYVNGQKMLVPKNILKTELVTAAEKLKLEASQSAGIIVNTCNESSQHTTLVSSTPLPESLVQEPWIPQQAVDLTTSPRDRRKHYDKSCSLAGSEFSEVNDQASELTVEIAHTIQPVQVQPSVRNENESWINTPALSPREQAMRAMADMSF